MSPLRNPFLLVGTLTALGVHLAAIYSPFFQDLLGVAPIDLRTWLELSALAAVIVVVMEVHKAWRRRRPLRP